MATERSSSLRPSLGQSAATASSPAVTSCLKWVLLSSRLGGNPHTGCATNAENEAGGNWVVYQTGHAARSSCSGTSVVSAPVGSGIKPLWRRFASCAPRASKIKSTTTPRIDAMTISGAPAAQTRAAY